MTVDDVSDTQIDAGFYEITFTLIDDRGNQVSEIVVIDVREPDPDEVIIASSTDESETTEDTNSSNSTANAILD